MKDVAFTPANITVHVGDRVAWTNGDIVAHTATSQQGGFDVNVPPGKRGSAVMGRPGSFDYICRYHPNMKGQIVVQPQGR
jgi:plastocyanin